MTVFLCCADYFQEFKKGILEHNIIAVKSPLKCAMTMSMFSTCKLRQSTGCAAKLPIELRPSDATSDCGRLCCRVLTKLDTQK